MNSELVGNDFADKFNQDYNHNCKELNLGLMKQLMADFLKRTSNELVIKIGNNLVKELEFELDILNCQTSVKEQLLKFFRYTDGQIVEDANKVKKSKIKLREWHKCIPWLKEGIQDEIISIRYCSVSNRSYTYVDAILNSI